MVVFRKKFVRLAVLWALFFVVCFSLGYPTLNRYDPRSSSLNDVIFYKMMVEDGIESVPDYHWRYRVMVPLIARPFAKLAHGHIGSWNSTFFGLLIANSLFIASAALVLLLVVRQHTRDERPGLIAALLFLLNFNVSNLYLGGLTDSSEVFAMVLLAFLLMNGRWLWLPAVSVIGSFGKETVVPISAAFAGGWYLAECWKQRRPFFVKGAMVFLMFAAGLTAVILFRSFFASNKAEIAALTSTEKYMPGDWWYMIKNNLLNKSILYTFGWLAPLGLFGLRNIQKPWVWASGAAVLAAVLLSLWANAGDNIGRPLFSAAGPMLIAAAAMFLWSFLDGRKLGDDGR